MTPKQEDVLYREFKATRYYNTGEFTAFRLAIRAAYAKGREDAAKVCEEPEPECCNRPIIRSNGEVDGCCGSPDPRPKTAEECAAAIRRGVRRGVSELSTDSRP